MATADLLNQTEELSEKQPAPRRLCSEVQLFDLCALDSCSFRDGRYCTDQTLLDRFEAIAEKDESRSDRFADMSEDEDDELSDDFGDEFDAEADEDEE